MLSAYIKPLQFGNEQRYFSEVYRDVGKVALSEMI